MRFAKMLLILVALAAAPAAVTGCGLRTTPTEAKAERIAERDRTAYTLPPKTLQKAIALDRAGRVLTVGGEVWGLLQLLLILRLGAAAKMRDVAVRLSANRWAQCACFVFLLLLTIFALNLPLRIYGHSVALRYGLSVQRWGGWLLDQTKVLALEWVIGGLLAMLLFRVMRWSPRRWWFWFWPPAVACVVAGVFLAPYVIDPLFNRFEPLANSDPALVARLEQIAERSGTPIPPDRMFLMKASAKSTQLNAYVTGFGASKRVVVWDTTVARSSPDEICFVFSHELGHYVLGHVVVGSALTCLGLLPCFWIGFHAMQWMLRHYGAAWRIPSQHDWGALVVVLLVGLTLSALSAPLGNAVSRWMEHNADVYGQEAMHGIVADPQAVVARSFQVLGEDSLDDPTPHPLFEWWYDTHPPIRFRAAFARAYDPWAPGEHPKYFTK